MFRTVVPTSVTWNEGFVSQRCDEDVFQIVFRAVVWTSVTWIWCFVSQGCGEYRGVERDGVDMYGEDMYGEDMYGEDMYGVDMYGEDGVSGSCADLCDMDLGFCVTEVWWGWGFGLLC